MTYDNVPANNAQRLVEASEGGKYWRRVEPLTKALLALDESVDPIEADQLARVAIYYPMQLAHDYQLSWPPVLHNIRVNRGGRTRGLCIDWAEDMLLEFARLELKSIELHWGVANLDSNWPLEHSCVVATAIGQPFEEGLVLDGWRHSGKLYFGAVADDKYAWQQLSNVVTDEAAMLVRGATPPPRDPDENPTMRHSAKRFERPPLLDYRYLEWLDESIRQRQIDRVLKATDDARVTGVCQALDPQSNAGRQCLIANDSRLLWVRDFGAQTELADDSMLRYSVATVDRFTVGEGGQLVLEIDGEQVRF